MATYQMVYRPGGINIATDDVNTTAAVYARINSVPPDSAEHDAGKEAIEIHWVKFNLARPCFATLIAAATNDRITFGWRPGLIVSTAVMNIAKWQARVAMTKIGATTGLTDMRDIAAFLDLRDSPIVADPACNTFEVDVSSSGATTFDAISGGFSVEYAYKWIKAGPNEFNAYLRWEALGL